LGSFYSKFSKSQKKTDTLKSLQPEKYAKAHFAFPYIDTVNLPATVSSNQTPQKLLEHYKAYLADGTICSDDGEEALLQMSGDELVVVVVAKCVDEMVVASDSEVGEPILSTTSTLGFSFMEVHEGLMVVVVGEQTG